MKTAPARLEEKYLGHGNDFDYVDTRTFLRAVENILPEVQPLFENTPARLTGACWPPSLGRNPTGIRRPPPHRRARYDDAHAIRRKAGQPTAPMQRRVSTAACATCRI